MIIALDCATKTGWAIANLDGTIRESGVQSFAKKRGESNGIMFLRFRRWLMELVENATVSYGGKPYVLVYERAHFRGGAPTEIGVGLQTRVQEVGAELSFPTLPVATGSLKKFATGIGNASKEDMMTAAGIVLGRRPISDDEADAVMLARFAASDIGTLGLEG